MSLAFSPSPTAAQVAPNLEQLSSEDAQAALDTIIAQVQENARSLQSLRNAHARISRLPKEVLTLIFIRVVEPITDYQPASWETHIKLTGVCRLWRDITMRTPAFWSCLPLYYSCKELPEMLARSKAHPISFRSCLGLGSRWDELDHLIGCLPALLDPERLEEFHLAWAEEKDHWCDPDLAPLAATCFQAFPATQAPLLRSLKVRLLAKRTHVPIHLLTIPKPSLRHLILENVAVDWRALNDDTKNTGRLSTMELKDIHPPIPQQILHQVLSASSHLVSMKIVNSLPNNPEFPETFDLPTIALPSLESYHLEQRDFAPILDVLLWTQLPDQASKIIRWPYDHSDNMKAKTLALLEQLHYSTKSTPAEGREHDTMAISVDSQGLEVTCSPWFEPGSLHLCFPSQAIAHVLKYLSVPTITSLRVSLSTTYASSNDIAALWLAFIRRHQHIDNFSFTSNAVPFSSKDKLFNIVDLMYPEIPYEEDKLLPNLESLSLGNVRLKKKRRTRLKENLVRQNSGDGPKPGYLYLECCQGVEYEFIEELEECLEDTSIEWAAFEEEPEPSIGSIGWLRRQRRRRRPNSDSEPEPESSSD